MSTIRRKGLNYIQRGLLVVCLASGALVAQAGQYWWAGDGANLGGSGTWDTSSNKWRSGSESGAFVAWPNGGSDEAVFTNAFGGTAGTVTLSGTNNASVLSFKTNAWTLSGGTLNMGSGASTITMANVPANSHQTINSTLTGSGTLTVSGQATYGFGLLLTANNSAFTGKIVVNQTGNYFGLAVTNDNALGAVPATYAADAITLKNGAFLINSAATTVSVATNRGIIFQSGGGLIYNRTSGSLVLNSPLVGSGNITCRGGTIFINATNNAYTGQFVVFADGGTTVKPGADNVFNHGPGVSSFYVTRYNGGTSLLDLNGYSQVLPALSWAGNGAATTRVIDTLAAGKDVTLTLGDNNSNTAFDGHIRNTAGTLSLTKVGTGVQTLSGTNSYTGATSVVGGTLLIDHVVYTNGTLGALVLGGGSLSVYGGGASTNSSQIVGNPTFAAGASGITVTNRGGNATLTLGDTWTRASGGVALITLTPGNGGISTLKSSPPLTNGLIGGHVLVRDAAGTGFATTNASGNVVRYTGATTLDATAAAADLTASANYVVSASQSLIGSSATQTVNSLEFSGTAALTSAAGKTLVVGSGGMLFNGSGTTKTQKLKVTSGTGELDVYLNAQSAQIEAEIMDNGTTSVSFVKWGPGTLSMPVRTWGASSTYSGDTVINQGELNIPGSGENVIPNGSGKGSVVINGSGILNLGGNNEIINGLKSASAAANIKNTGSLSALTLGNNDATASYAGSIGSGGAAITLIKVGGGTQTLSGVNTYSGGTILSNGVLSVSSTNNIGGANAKVIFAGGTLRINGAAFNSFGATPLTFTGAGGGLEIADAGNTVTLTNNLGSGTVLDKTGAGLLSLTGTQAGTITTDDPSKISFGTGLGFYNLGVTTNGVLSPAGSGSIGDFAVNNNFTLAGKLLVDVTASTNDTVTVGGTITLSAGATLEIVNTALLERSKKYAIMRAGGGAVSGSLPALNLPDRWKVSAVGNTVVLYYAYPGTMIGVF